MNKLTSRILVGTKLQSEIKQQIILSVETEKLDVVRKKKADCLAELARKLFGKFKKVW